MIYFFTVYKDARGEWRWFLAAKNGRKVADSGEGYTTKQGATNAVKRLQDATTVLRTGAHL